MGYVMKPRETASAQARTGAAAIATALPPPVPSAPVEKPYKYIRYVISFRIPPTYPIQTRANTQLYWMEARYSRMQIGPFNDWSDMRSLWAWGNYIERMKREGKRPMTFCGWVMFDGRGHRFLRKSRLAHFVLHERRDWQYDAIYLETP